jgi:hypothetical protein
MLAARCGDAKTVRLLLEHGADAERLDAKGSDALAKAKKPEWPRRRNDEVVRLLSKAAWAQHQSPSLARVAEVWPR